MNLDKTNIIKFKTNNSPQYPLTVGSNKKYIEQSINMKFLGFRTDKHLNCKNLWVK
jgi:hypothetical protein